MEVSRRKFMLGVGAVAAAPAVLGDAQKVFKVGLVGCGGRGTGAIQNIMDAAALLGCKVQLTATADFFPDKAKAICKKYGVDEKMAFGGANGYKNVIASGCDIVLLCAPPVFRPRHIAACVAAGKHIFAEKPIATARCGTAASARSWRAASTAATGRSGCVRAVRPTPTPATSATTGTTSGR